jgi:hypothetical protein
MTAKIPPIPESSPGVSHLQILGRHICTDQRGQLVRVEACRHMLETMTGRGARRYPGARFWRLEDGEKVRLIDDTMFEVIGTGDILYRQDAPEDEEEAGGEV